MERAAGAGQTRGIFLSGALIIAGAALLRASLAWYDHSVFWPDEIYQSLEQAHRAVFGYGLVPWEFRDGARSWVFPGAIAALWHVASWLGIDSSLTLVTLARLAMVASSVVAIWFAVKLAAASSGRRAAIAAAVILATFPPLVVFSYRTMSETASAPLIVIGAWYLSRRSPRTAMYAGLAIAGACLFRYQNGLFALMFAAALLLERRWREALGYCGVGVVVALVGGALDWLTWGRPFHSLLTYIDFNLVVDGASKFGVEPFSFFITTLWSSVGPLFAVLLVCFCVGTFAQPMLGGAVAAYVLAHSVLPHKEFRFLVPCLPLFVTVAAVGVERLLARLPAQRAIAWSCAFGTTAIFGYGLMRLTYDDMGQYKGTSRSALSAWKSEEEASLLLADAGNRDDLCGVAVLQSRAAFTGGYTYLHRNVPLIYEGEFCSMAVANYVIAPVEHAQSLPQDYAMATQRGQWALYHRGGTCRPSDDDRLLDGARDMGLVLQKPQQAPDGALRFDLRRDAAAFVDGWGHGETVQCDAARWATATRAFVTFDFVPGPRQYRLGIRARAHQVDRPQRFSISVNGTSILKGWMTPNYKTYAADVPVEALKHGENRIQFAFSSAARASATDDRTLAALFRSIELVPKHDDFTVDLAAGESRPHLARGFHAREQAGDTTFVWSEGPSSEVVGDLPWPQAPYVLQILAEAVPLVPSQRTRVFVNDMWVGTLNFPPAWSTQRLVVPTRALARGRNRVRFEYEATVRPASVDGKLEDQRELAVRFRRIEMTPIAAGPDLDLGTTAARPFLTEGWSTDERDGERSVVWSDGPRASAVLSFQGLKKPILRMSGLGYGRALPNKVTVSLNGKPVGAFAAPDGWQDIEVPLPAGNYTDAGEIITFDFERTARPSDDNPASRDHRSLALRVDRLWVESEENRPTINASVRALHADVTANPGGVASHPLATSNTKP